MAESILLYLCGAPSPEIAAAHGDYGDWFRRLVAPTGAELAVFDGTGGALPPDWERHAGLVLSGSPASLTEPEPWMESAVELVREAWRARHPTLGVCFGHQVLGAAFGGSVVANPAGWELSTYELELTCAGRGDPLFDGIADRFEVNLSHRDVVAADSISAMNGLTVLARSARCAVQALAAGPAVRGVQFHPEFDGVLTAAHAASKRERLVADGEDPAALAAGARDCPDAERIFQNWVRHYVTGA